MNIKEYQQLASRTCLDLGTKADNHLHMKIGVVTEIGELLDQLKCKHAYGKELDIVNVGEEIADICWYVVNDATFEKLTLNHIPENFLNLVWISDVVDAADRILASWMATENNEISGWGLYGPYNQISILKSIAEYFKLDFYQILANNINKLKIRYPDKFDAEKALNRDLDSERKELEA